MATQLTDWLFLMVMQRHIGVALAATAKALVAEIKATGASDCSERDLRHMVVALRKEGHHICAHPKCGYFLAATPEELDETCEFLYRRALCSLQQVSTMKRVSLPDLRGQLRLRNT